MRKIFFYLFSIVLGAVVVCNAVPLTGNQAKVASQGVTDVATVFGKTEVAVKITTHEVDIGKPSDGQPQKRTNSCTYSRFPCSQIDYLEIFVNGNALFVARSVYADLADVNEASVNRKKKGQYVLTLNGGDASESFTVEIMFDENRVKKRTFMNNEAREIMQETTYFSTQPLD